MRHASNLRSAVIRLAATLAAASALMIAGCTEENPVGPGSDNIRTGAFTSVGTNTVTTAGGRLTVGAGGGDIAGMTIDIPSGAFSSSRTFEVSFAAIESHKLGASFNPISPLIRISNGGGYAALPMTIRIPIRRPAGHFAMGFLYNEVDGKIEGLPLLAEDDTSITISTRHFATSSISGAGKRGVAGGALDATSAGNLVIASISESMLTGSPIISTGFTPGTDDWEFINRGSYLAPNGHCAGQSMTAMWYFYEQKLRNAQKLNHRFDSVNISRDKLSEDNPLGYRFASTVQCDMKWDGLLRDLMIKVRTSAPSLSFKAFAFAMLLTGEPQYVGIRKEGKGGHAMVAYKISYSQGKLWVADPNHPGNTERIIEFDGSRFKPYHSALNADDEGIDFDEIGYFAKTAFIDWSAIGSRWGELVGGTIGDDRFPAYDLWVLDGAGYELGDSLTTDLDSLAVTVRNLTNGGFICYDRSGNVVNDANGVIKLRPGKNVLGFWVVAKPTVDCEGYAVATPGYEWVDFRWVTVTYGSVAIEPEVMTGKPGTQYMWSATVQNPPASVRYVWHWGDVSAPTTRIDDSTATHLYTLSGEYSIHLEAFDNGSGHLIGEAYATATIGDDDILTRYHQTTQASISLQALNTYSNGETNQENWNFANNILLGDWPSIAWNGRSFSMSHTLVRYDGTDETTLSMSGTISADGLTIETANVDFRQVLLQRFGGKVASYTTTRKMTIRGLNGTEIPGQLPFFYKSGSDVAAFVTAMSATYRYVDENGVERVSYNLASTDWSSGTTILQVTFMKP